jgi:HupE / UreJ protein
MGQFHAVIACRRSAFHRLFMHLFTRCWQGLLLLVACASAQAHLMVAQKGTLNLQGDGAYLVVSLPVSAFIGVDDDGDGAWSAHELGVHGPQIQDQLKAQLRLRDAQGSRPIDGITWVPTPPDDKPGDPVTQLVVLARFKLSQNVSDDASDTAKGLWFHAGLFGRTEAEQQLSIAVSQGSRKQLMVLTAERPEQALFPSGARVVADYVVLGVMHILTGWDHLLFLAVVLLGGGTWRQILAVLSAFTLGHALTLAWGLLGTVPFDTAWVEPGIAVTIVGMAALEAWQHQHARLMPMRWRLVCVFACALVHGLGLASSLLAIGLDAAHRLWSLLGFNLGVELAQCAVALALGLLLGRLLGRLTAQQQQRIRQMWLACAALTGSFWLVERLL